MVVFNVKYSPNLGDGLIAEAIEGALGQAGGGVSAQTFDLAGRHAWGQVATRHRRAKLAVLGALPAAARREVTALGLKRGLAGGFARVAHGHCRGGSRGDRRRTPFPG